MHELFPCIPILGVFIFLFGVKKGIMGWRGGGGGGGGGRGIKFTWEFSLNIINITLLTKQFTCLKVAEYHTHCIITKRGGESGAAGVFQEKLIPFLEV